MFYINYIYHEFISPFSAGVGNLLMVPGLNQAPFLAAGHKY